MMARGRWLVLWGWLACVTPAVFALTPPLGYQEPTMDEVWDQSAFIAYGRIVRIELAATPDRKDGYLAIFRVERCWKGRLPEEIVIIGNLREEAPPLRQLEFNRTYILELAKSGNAKAYIQQGAQELSLPFAATSFANHPYLTWLEFLERKAGNTDEAGRLRQMRGQDSLDREAGKSLNKVFTDKVTADFKTAMQETGVAERKALLEALLKQIEFRPENELVALAAKVKAEISVSATFLGSGIKTFP